MKLEQLRAEVLEANLEVVRRGLVLYTFGNASGISREEGIIVIKPSGVPYDSLRPEHMVLTDLDGRTIEGDLNPSSDLATHVALYKAFQGIGGIVHTHSRYATAWAQAGREIPCLGTTHADYFRGPIPVTDVMKAPEITTDYEWNTGQAIVRRFAALDYRVIPAVLVAGHAPFCWGPAPAAAAHNAVVLEEVAWMSYHTLMINSAADALSEVLRDKHFLRKHGPGAYYGQK